MKLSPIRCGYTKRPLWSVRARAIFGCTLVAIAFNASAQRLPSTFSTRSNDQLFCDGFDLDSSCALPPKPPVIALEQLSPLPNSEGGGQSIQFRAGWPLIFRASVADEDMLGLGRVYAEQGFEIQGWQFPEVGQGAAIVFDDPDGFWSFSIPSAASNDERVLDFYPDPGDVSGVVDSLASGPFSHDTSYRYSLRPEFGGPLPRQAPDGTQVQVSVADGVQFGSDDDFPGLVIVSNIGVGIVMTSLADGWVEVLPRQARNLAGLSNSVGYELTDALGRTSITTMMIVPRFLFSHVRVRDLCVGNVTLNGDGEPESCDGVPFQRFDGGPPTPVEPATSIDDSLVEIRAFVVEPIWNSVNNRLDYLDIVTDMNNDGVVSAADAEAMGRRVLSNEVVYSFRQIGSNVSGNQINSTAPLAFCNGLARPADLTQAGADFEYDIDNNGYSVVLNAVICPGGGSGVSRPPR